MKLESAKLRTPSAANHENTTQVLLRWRCCILPGVAMPNIILIVVWTFLRLLEMERRDQDPPPSGPPSPMTQRFGPPRSESGEAEGKHTVKSLHQTQVSNFAKQSSYPAQHPDISAVRVAADQRLDFKTLTVPVPPQNKSSKAFTLAALSGDGGPLTYRSSALKWARISARNLSMLA